MINYGLIQSTTRPQPIEITDNSVFIATNIEEYEKQIEDDYIEKGFQYNYVSYTKDEYIKQIHEDNVDLKEQVLETQEALIELYEMLGD